jgi:hypothetical protein
LKNSYITNLSRLRTLLAETSDEPRRQQLSKLLAEEEAKDQPVAASAPVERADVCLEIARGLSDATLARIAPQGGY